MFSKLSSSGKIDALKALAASKNGLLLSDTIEGMKTKLMWQCEKGHQWKASLNSILYSGSWCPVCAGNLKLTIEAVKEIAKKRGGKCLSESYHNSKEKLLWQCKKGHQWEASTFSVKTRKSWCPVCYQNKIKNKSHEY